MIVSISLLKSKNPMYASGQQSRMQNITFKANIVLTFLFDMLYLFVGQTVLGWFR